MHPNIQKLHGSRYRLVTRSDFDGLVCGMLLTELGLIDEIKFVHPKDMQDGLIVITDRDITTNLPYVGACAMAFDHHESEGVRNKDIASLTNYVLDGKAPSAARVVYEWLGGLQTFPMIDQGMMLAVDKADSAQFSMEDVMNPSGWELLSFLMDARTGLGRFRDFRISNYQLMMLLIDYCKTHNINEIMQQPDVRERMVLYCEHEGFFKDQIHRCTKVYKNLVILDLRNEDLIYAGNRFVIYAMFPQVNVSIHVIWGLKKQNVVFATGKSIFDRTSKTDIGSLMLTYGGGGHAAAGTCQVPIDKAEQVLQELITKINSDG